MAIYQLNVKQVMKLNRMKGLDLDASASYRLSLPENPNDGPARIIDNYFHTVAELTLAEAFKL